MQLDFSRGRFARIRAKQKYHHFDIAQNRQPHMLLLSLLRQLTKGRTRANSRTKSISDCRGFLDSFRYAFCTLFVASTTSSLRQLKDLNTELY